MDSYDYMMQSQRDPYKLAHLEAANPPPPRKRVWKEDETLWARHQRIRPDCWEWYEWEDPSCG